MTHETYPFSMTRIIFKFRGGPRDGETLVGEPGEESEAERYYVLSHRGRLGQQFRTASEYAVETLLSEDLGDETPHQFQAHVYKVIDRIQNDDIVLVRAEYVPPPTPTRR